jgi:surface polysaccharide O-acyltransferase-like enzyme
MDKYLSVKLKVISLFLMIMVITLHANNLNTENPAGHKGYSLFIQTFLSSGIAFVAVPLFFLISGYLFFFHLKGTRTEFITKINKRAKTLLIPYIFWSLWGMTVFIVLQSLPQSKPFFNSSPILKFSASQFLSTFLLNPLPYQLWFVRDLMMLVLFSPVVYSLLKYLKYFTVIVFFIPWVFDVTFYVFTAQSLLFFIIGGYIGMEKKELLNIRLSGKHLLFTFLWIGLAIFKTILLQIEYQNVNIITQLHKLTVLVGVFSVWSLYDILFSKKDLSQSKIYPVFSYTFFLYAFHEPILTILKKGMLFAIGKSEIATLIIYFVTILVTAIIGLLTAAVVSKVLPRFYALITGGR